MSEDTSDDVRRGDRTHPLTARVLSLVADVREAAVTDDETGSAAAVEALDAGVARVHRGRASVVVVGEKKRGKSSLVNALVDRPGVLPVDADVATCVHVVVAQGEGTARVSDTDGQREISLDEVGEYAALDPDLREPRHEGVDQVAVLLPSPLLAGGLELIDTPGVGGLVAGHAALTLATLDRADALLFVLDGSSEITASELAFLERATERIATVVFVLTKIDAFPSWERIRARNEGLIAEHAPRYADAPWFAVSSRAPVDAARAEAAGRPEVAQRRRAAGGLAPLAGYLAELAETADGLRLANLAHQGSALAQRLAAAQVRRALSLTLSPEFGELIAREKAALTGLQSQNAQWRQTLAERAPRLEQRMRTELARRLEDLRKDLGDRIAAGDTSVFDSVAADLPLRAQALWVELDTMLRRELDELATAVVADLDGTEVDVADVVPDLPERLAQLPQAARGQSSTSLAEQGIMAMGMGMGIFHLVTMSAAAVLLPVGIIAGVGVVGALSWRRRRKEQAARSREDARRYLGEVTGRLNTEIPPVVSQAVAAAREVLTTHITAALAAEKERLTASLAEHEKNLASEKSALARQKTETEAKLRARNELRETGAALEKRLRGEREETQ